VASYVESVLADGEKIIHRASMSHWNFLVSYVIGIALIIAGFGALAMREHQGASIMAVILLALGLVVILSAVIRRHTTELVLTDRRIITKRGIISRATVEMNLGKVESVHVNQSLLGRMLNYGDITVVGTGSSLEPLVGIARPLDLRRKLGEMSQVRESKPSV
jgi:uncharacterized membrane protein YdbT with pleckstrin-like domain